MRQGLKNPCRILLAFKYSVIYTVSVDYEKQKRNAEQTVNFEVFQDFFGLPLAKTQNLKYII